MQGPPQVGKMGIWLQFSFPIRLILAPGYLEATEPVARDNDFLEFYDLKVIGKYKILHFHLSPKTL